MHKRRPALLKSESQDEHDKLREEILSAIKRQSPIEDMFAEDVIVETWHVTRLQNAKAQIITHRATNQKRLSDRVDDREHGQESGQNLKAGLESELEDESTRKQALEDLLVPIANAIDEEEKEARGIADAVALESSIESQIKMDRLIDAAYKRRSESLRHLKWRREELVEILKGASDARNRCSRRSRPARTESDRTEFDADRPDAE